MSEKKRQLTANEAWKKLLEKYPVADQVEKTGYYKMTADQIREYREPRLMAKWDSSDSLPEALRRQKLNLLPDSRNSYLIGDFLLYQEIPELKEHVTQMAHVDLPEYESIDVNHITSEANATHALILSGILDDFLGEGRNDATFNGRMGTGVFDFWVNTERGIRRRIHVENAQCEIDGGFENPSSVVILEAKNVVHSDFHVRQLYYPYRLWKERVRKPVRLVFSIYSNMIYRLFEYRFTDPEDYSSIELVRMKNYSLQDTHITKEELMEVRKRTPVRTSDAMEETEIPFIQANSMERIISLWENMHKNPMTAAQIAELMDFEPRQSDYYFNAGRYLGLFEKQKNGGQVQVCLTPEGEKLLKLDYKPRQLRLAELMLEHEIFAEFFDRTAESGALPDKKEIEREMRRLHVCNEGQIVRRASSVYGWLKWLFNLTRL